MKNRFKDMHSLKIHIINQRYISNFAKKFRQSNLIRHNYIAYPLINYTNYESSLINWDQFEMKFTEKSYRLNQKTRIFPTIHSF